jgi:AraC-like DNA-binding protein
MEKVADYLKNTSYTAAAITEETGFSSPNHLFRAFRRYYHTSPKEYRKKHSVKKTGGFESQTGGI